MHCLLESERASDDEIILTSEDLDDAEKVVAGALISLKQIDLQEVGGARAARDALDGIHEALVEAQGDVVGACPRCTSLLALNLKHIAALLDVYAPKERVFEGSWYGTRGELGPPLGSHRLRAVEVVVQMIQAQSELVDSYIIATETMAKCVRLFFEYPSSSALHCAVASLCEAVLRGPSQEMIHALLVSSKLCQFLAEAASRTVGVPPGSRPVNTGFVIDLSLAIHDVEVACPSVQDWLDEVPTWKEHVSHMANGPLSTLLGEQQGPTIGGPLPSAEQEDDDWLHDDPVRREEELIRVINSFGTCPPPQELLDALERSSMERQMLEIQTLEMQASFEARAKMEMEREMEAQRQMLEWSSMGAGPPPEFLAVPMHSGTMGMQGGMLSAMEMQEMQMEMQEMQMEMQGMQMEVQGVQQGIPMEVQGMPMVNPMMYHQ